MTPANPDALADAIERMMKGMSLLGGDDLRTATHKLGALAHIHSTRIVRALRSETALQRVTAERDEARAKIDAARAVAGGWPVLEGQETVAGKIMTLAAAARQAPLGERGTQFVLQHLMRALDAADAAEARAAQLQAEVEALKGKLTEIAADAAKGARCTFKASFKQWFARIEDTARTALAARAATAREGAPPPSPTPSDSV